MTDDAPSFDISRRPERVYPPEGGIEYAGGTVFRLTPASAPTESELAALVDGVLEADRYTYGDWFDLPAPVYLVYDERCATAFRVVVRSGTVEFHVLPETAASALRELYTRLGDAADFAWRVDRETTAPD